MIEISACVPGQVASGVMVAGKLAGVVRWISGQLLEVIRRESY